MGKVISSVGLISPGFVASIEDVEHESEKYNRKGIRQYKMCTRKGEAHTHVETFTRDDLKAIKMAIDKFLERTR